MPANFSGALLKQPSGRGNKAASPRAMPFPPNLMEEACTPGSQIDNEHENDDEHDWAHQKKPKPVIPLRALRVLRAMPSPPNLAEEACTPGLQIDNEHENDDEHDCARQKKPKPVIPLSVSSVSSVSSVRCLRSNLAEEDRISASRPLLLVWL